MQKIDAHQHFWKFDPIRDSWIDDTMQVIQKDFLPQDLEPLLESNEIDGCVTVQSTESEDENNFHLENANRYGFIKGIVGWVDLQADNIEERLQHYEGFKKIKGFRHVLQGEPRRDLMLQPKFRRGISLLNRYGFTYDLLILPDQLAFAKELVRAYPGQKFVIDHLAKPPIKEGRIGEWKRDMEALAPYENLYCKISGMVTEAEPYRWQKTHFTPYMDVVVENFGMERIMYGSDWPVCLLSASYAETLEIVNDYFSSFSEGEKERFFGGNAIEFYNLY
jgi:L-fuconolactonase